MGACCRRSAAPVVAPVPVDSVVEEVAIEEELPRAGRGLLAADDGQPVSPPRGPIGGADMGGSCSAPDPQPEPVLPDDEILQVFESERQREVSLEPPRLPTVPEEPESYTSSPVKPHDWVDQVDQELKKDTEARQEQRFKEFCDKATPQHLEELKDIPGKLGRRPSTVGIGLDAYLEQHGAEFRRGEEMRDSTNWVFKKREEDVDIYTMQLPGQHLSSFKGVTKIRTQGRGIHHIFFGLSQVQERPKWDELCISGRTLEAYPPYYRVVYYQLQAPVGFIANRDALVVARVAFQEDGSITVCASSPVSDHLVPEDPEFVRTCIDMLCYFVAPTADPDEFEVTAVGSVDLCGWIPNWVKNVVMWKQTLTLAKLRLHLEK